MERVTEKTPKGGDGGSSCPYSFASSASTSASYASCASPPVVVRSIAGRLLHCVCVTTQMKRKAGKPASESLHYPADRRHLLQQPSHSPSRHYPQLFVMQPFSLSVWLLLLACQCVAVTSNLPPRFTTDPNGPGAEIVVVVKEGAESLGKEILQITGEDPDGDELTFGSTASDLIRVVNHVPSRNSAVVYLNKELDRETKDSHSLVLTLTDGKLGSDKFVSVLPPPSCLKRHAASFACHPAPSLSFVARTILSCSDPLGSRRCRLALSFQRQRQRSPAFCCLRDVWLR